MIPLDQSVQRERETIERYRELEREKDSTLSSCLRISGLQSDSAKSGISRFRGGAGDLSESPSELFTYNIVDILLCHVSIVGTGN